MKARSRNTIAVLALVALAAGAALAQPATPTLYQRLGGYDAIAAVTDEFLGRLLSDAQFDRFFSGHSADSKARIRQLIVDQLCAATGGPCIYTGRDMETVHTGLGINEADWTRAVEHLSGSLDKFAVPATEKAELLGAASSMKADIVEAP